MKTWLLMYLSSKIIGALCQSINDIMLDMCRSFWNYRIEHFICFNWNPGEGGGINLRIPHTENNPLCVIVNAFLTKLKLPVSPSHCAYVPYQNTDEFQIQISSYIDFL